MNKDIFLKEEKKKQPIYSRLCGTVVQKQLCKDVSGCSGKMLYLNSNTSRSDDKKAQSNKCSHMK